MLGWDYVPVRVVENLVDATLALRAEGDENAQRKDLTPNEAVKLGEALEPLEREAAKKRQSVLNNSRYANYGSIHARHPEQAPQQKHKHHRQTALFVR